MAITAPPPTNADPSPINIKPGQLFIDRNWRDAEGGKDMSTSSPTTSTKPSTRQTARFPFGSLK